MIFLDFETRSFADLKRVGGHNYIAAPSTEILCLVLHDEAGGDWVGWTPFVLPLRPIVAPGDGRVRMWQGDSGLAQLLAWLEARRDQQFVAHNATGFDEPAWRAAGLPMPAGWVDTISHARRAGLPGKLDAIGKLLFDAGKSAGRQAMLRLSQPRNERFVEPTTDTLSACIQYCADDVEIMRRLWVEECAPADQLYPSWEREVMQVDAVINRRGFGFDSVLAAQLLREETHLRAREARIIGELTKDCPAGQVRPGTLRSTHQLHRWLRKRGYSLPDMTSERVLAVIEHPHCDSLTRAVLWARIGATKVAAAKLDRACDLQGDDDRLRGGLAYYAAHTGRWGGRGFQPQNLPRPSEKVPADLADAVRADRHELRRWAAANDVPRDEVIATLVRSCIVAAPGKLLGVADYAAIEGRGVCWLADDQDGLDVYRSGRDPYVVQAAMLYGREYDEILAEKKADAEPGSTQRQVGKQIVLGCGYQMGPERFAGACASAGVDLAAAGTTAQDAVEAFRDMHPAIAGSRTGAMFDTGERLVVVRKGGLWRALGQAAFDVVQHGLTEPVWAGRCRWQMRGPHMLCWLPSGRPLIYRNARIELVEPSWGGDKKPAVTYDHVIGSSTVRATTYGGKLCENITQAVCRDLMALALVRLERAGIPVVLHVHDEIIVELDDAGRLQEFVDLMVDPPAWAAGFPVVAEGHAATRYSKEPPAGSERARASAEIL